VKGFNYYISDKADGNMSFYAGDGDVTYNRRNILGKLSYSLEDLVVMNQTHSSNFMIVTKEHAGQGAYTSDNAIDNVDALITNTPDIVLMAQGADCPLLVVYNDEAKVFAVIHSGWRGTKAGIVPKILSSMVEDFGCNHEISNVIVAPFAKGCCYEVGDDYKQEFVGFNHAFNKKNNRLYFDLGVVLKDQLLSSGVPESKIDFRENCTICNADYFSYRREKDASGRFSLFACITG